MDNCPNSVGQFAGKQPYEQEIQGERGLQQNLHYPAEDKRSINQILSSPNALKRRLAQLKKKEEVQQMKRERDKGMKI